MVCPITYGDHNNCSAFTLLTHCLKGRGVYVKKLAPKQIIVENGHYLVLCLLCSWAEEDNATWMFSVTSCEWEVYCTTWRGLQVRLTASVSQWISTDSQAVSTESPAVVRRWLSHARGHSILEQDDCIQCWRRVEMDQGAMWFVSHWKSNLLAFSA